MEKEINFTKIIINNITGEILDEEIINLKNDKDKITKTIIKEILSNPDINNETKIKKLLHYLFCRKLLNPIKPSQIRVYNRYDYETKIYKAIEDIINISKYIFRLINIADSYNNCLKINFKHPCETWCDIFEALSLSNKTVQQKFKKFCIKHSLIRKAKFGEDSNFNWTRFYLNPLFKKKNDYITDYTLYIFKDIFEDNKAVNEFVIDLLKLKYE